jgi:pyrimidine-nucleoside phosphorylase
MRAVDIIARKRDGETLSDAEIQWFVQAYADDDIPDYQAAAFCMAVLLRGMNAHEVTALTLAMAHSGDMLDLSDVAGYVVDKHSSGGVGDKTSLVVLPVVAAFDVPVAKMSGRGLGLTGGTLDKMESIPGFRSDLSEDQLRDQARSIGLALAGQTRSLAPADGKLYALRDTTATVPSIPLIASSIMSKKLAAGADGIVLDVKVGSGAFMRDLDRARELARMMVDIGQNAGRDVVALLSDMEQPLGQAVGNALEVIEAIETLRGGGPAGFREHCVEVAAHMLMLAGHGAVDSLRDPVRAALDDGRGLRHFRQMVAAQGGDVSAIDDTSRLPQASITEVIPAEHDGYVAQMSALHIAQAAFDLGAGREVKEATIDHAVGIQVHAKVGDRVTAGDPLVTIHANHAERVAEVRAGLGQGLQVSDSPVEPLPLFYDIIR